MTHPQRIAYFISPHGFGHAARSAAVMEAMLNHNPTLQFEIFTTVPAWFFAESLSLMSDFGYHSLLTDIGLVQHDSLTEDLPQTIKQLDRFLPFDPALLADLARQIKELGCDLVICDIAPLGIAVAHQAGLEAVLIENFTWDWIYEGYPAYAQALTPYINYLKRLFAQADYHIQTEPICQQTEPICQPGPVDLIAAPVSRGLRATPTQVRQSLGVPAEAQLLVFTMGGVNWDYAFLKQLTMIENLYVITAGHAPQLQSEEQLIFLNRDSRIFHPDLMNASDAVIGKLGYSTIAEIYWAGVPFGYIERPQFRESALVADYVQANMPSLCFPTAQFQNGDWLNKLPDLLALPRVQRNQSNGAKQIAEFIGGLVS